MISFRAMAPDDADAVACIEHESFATPWSREDFWREASNDFTCYIVALEDTDIIGFAGCWISFDEAQVTNIAVTAIQRNKGCGKLLMEQMMCAAVARGVERMTLEVRPSNMPAIRLYERLGFSAVGVRKGYYQDNGEDAILMWNTKLKDFVNERCAGETDARD